MAPKSVNATLLVLLLLALPFLMSAQSAPQSQVLVVNGLAGKTGVLLLNGRSYVDVEALAQIADGTVTIKDNQITLTVPPAPPADGSAQQNNPGFSKGFLSAAIEATAAVREWRTGIATAVQNSISVTDSWV